MEKIYRLLILTSSTGGGHDARADTLAAWAREIYGEKVEVKILRPLESKTSAWGRFGVGLYNFIQRWMPFLHKIYFYVIEVVGDIKGETFIGQELYAQTLLEFQPQMIVSLHDFIGERYFQLAHQLLGENTRCATYCGEFSGGEGFSKHWASPSADRWIGRTEGTLREAFKRGVNPDAMERFTFFLSPEEVDPMRAPSRTSLGLDESRLTILFASGTNGGVNHLRLLRQLEPFKDRVQAIVVCGLNETLRRQIALWQAQTEFPMILEGYSARMRSYLQIADVMVFKGGSNTAARAFYEGCPMWFDVIDGVMPQEALTMNFFTQTGAGSPLRSTGDFAEKVRFELDMNGELEDLKRNILASRNRHKKPAPREFFEGFLRWGFAHEKKSSGMLAVKVEVRV